MNRNCLNDLKGIFRGIQLIFWESCKYQKNAVERIWDNSSIRSLVGEQTKSCQTKLHGLTTEDVSKMAKETFERASMVFEGVRVFASKSYEQVQTKEDFEEETETTEKGETAPYPDLKNLPKGVSPDDLKVSELHHKDKELIEKLEKEYEMQQKALLEQLKKEEKKSDFLEEKKEMQQKAESEQLNKEQESSTLVEKEKDGEVLKSESTDKETEKEPEQPAVRKYVPKRPELDPEAKQRKVPASRVGRMISFGGLAAGLGIGAIAEATRRTLGFSEKVEKDKPPTLDQLFLTEANAERIVNTLCKVRGAALKIGQILSIQDNTVISPVLQKAFERVRQSADFMPTWQVHKVLAKELGPNWKDKLSYFEEKPFAAASIGQVHFVRLKDGRECAMKIQYPGVAKGIESDINNLVGVLKIWNVFPKGLFIDNLIEVAKRELSWEVDYIREAECTKKFRELLKPYPEYVLPEVIDELSTAEVFTSTFLEGIPMDQCIKLDDDHKLRITKLIMQLCLREIFEFRYMQTDPNWSNFLYDENTEKLSLIDFGASRSYDVEFVKKYIEVIKAAADRDKPKVIKLSQEMGFLTGYESKSMQDAHANAVMILAEVFSSEKPFDFGRQDTTARIQKLVPTIVAERLCPPPEEIYSLHRKLSGVFLLCAKFKVKISCREMFMEVYRKFKKETS